MLFCCFIYHGGLQSRSVPTSSLVRVYRSGQNPRGAVPLESSSVRFPSAQPRLWPLLSCGVRLSHGRKKSHLQLPRHGSPYKRGEACVNGFHSLTVTTTGGTLAHFPIACQHPPGCCGTEGDLSISNGFKSVHPSGHPISHSTHVGFNCPEVG